MNLGLDKLKLSLSLSMGIALKLVPYLGAGRLPTWDGRQADVPRCGVFNAT